MGIPIHILFFYAKLGTDVEIHRILWPKAPAKDGALDQMSRNFQVYFIHIIFLRNQLKISQQSKRVILRCYYICFSILHCLLA